MALKAIFAAWHRLLEQWAFAGMVNRYRAAGHATPIFAASQELFLRTEYLERFRDFASNRFDLGFSLDEVKSEFIRDNLTPKTTILDRADNAAIRAIITDMRVDEAYHQPQYERWCAEADAFQRKCQDEMRRRHPGSRSPLTRRVLLGR